MSVLVRVALTLVGFVILLGIGAALSAITGLEIGLAELIIVGVVAAIAIPVKLAH